MSDKEIRGHYPIRGLGRGEGFMKMVRFDLGLKRKGDFSMLGVGGGHSGLEAMSKGMVFVGKYMVNSNQKKKKKQ